jgi:hypothetical protein
MQQQDWEHYTRRPIGHTHSTHCLNGAKLVDCPDPEVVAISHKDGPIWCNSNASGMVKHCSSCCAAITTVPWSPSACNC